MSARRCFVGIGIVVMCLVLNKLLVSPHTSLRVVIVGVCLAALVALVLIRLATMFQLGRGQRR